MRVHRDKLTPRFKANSPTRKLSARISSYLSGLLYFLGVLEVCHGVSSGPVKYFVDHVPRGLGLGGLEVHTKISTCAVYIRSGGYPQEVLLR